MRRELPGGYELDDDPGRIDAAAVHRYLSEESYWARGRTLEQVQGSLASAARVVGLYKGGEQVGFARVVSDGFWVAYLADVYVLEEHRGDGRGTELVKQTLDHEPLGNCSWMLHTHDAHGLYASSASGRPTTASWSESGRGRRGSANRAAAGPVRLRSLPRRPRGSAARQAASRQTLGP